MLCVHPGRHHKCGQCLNCRINARRIWASRIMLEAQSHSASCFATFTYETPPEGNILVKRHLSETLHRLRERYRAVRQIRFFGVGEYGEHGARPHYHAAIFGVSPSDRDILESVWSHKDKSCVSVPGFVHTGFLTPDSAQYIAGYITKKLTKPEAEALQGRTPEFAVMSRRPGIGATAIQPLIDALNTSEGALYMGRLHDVPHAFQVAGRLLPLGPYIRGMLRMFFFGEATQPKAAKENRDKLFKEQVAAFVPSMPLDPALLERIQTLSSDSQTLVTLLQGAYIEKQESTRRVRARQVSTRHKIHQSRKIL